MKKTNRLKVTISIMITAFATSCIHTYYVPHSPNIPVFSEKGQARIAAAYATSFLVHGAEVQAAYAFDNHFAGLLNFHVTGETYADSIEKTVTTGIEAGGGYFSKLNNEGSVIAEVYAGMGYDRATNVYSLKESSKVTSTRFFLQPSIAFALPRDLVQFAVASRFSYAHFTVLRSSASVINNRLHAEDIQAIRSAPNHFFWEPSLLLRKGLGRLKTQTAMTFSKPFKQPAFFTERFVFSIGVLYFIN